MHADPGNLRVCFKLDWVATLKKKVAKKRYITALNQIGRNRFFYANFLDLNIKLFT